MSTNKIEVVYSTDVETNKILNICSLYQRHCSYNLTLVIKYILTFTFILMFVYNVIKIRRHFGFHVEGGSDATLHLVTFFLCIQITEYTVCSTILLVPPFFLRIPTGGFTVTPFGGNNVHLILIGCH